MMAHVKEIFFCSTIHFLSSDLDSENRFMVQTELIVDSHMGKVRWRGCYNVVFELNHMHNKHVICTDWINQGINQYFLICCTVLLINVT